jgi:hypothetical protein
MGRRFCSAEGEGELIRGECVREAVHVEGTPRGADCGGCLESGAEIGGGNLEAGSESNQSECLGGGGRRRGRKEGEE